MGDGHQPGDTEGEKPPAPASAVSDEFFRRVLHHLPRPHVVVDESGTLLYINQAMQVLGGWDLNEVVGTNMIDYLHHNDQADIAEAFAAVTEAPTARVLGTGKLWSSIFFRLIASNGDAVPVEAVGQGGVLDPVVGGIIYEISPARTKQMTSRVLLGLSRGAPMSQLLTILAQVAAAPPLNLDVLILEESPGAEILIAATTATGLAELMHGEDFRRDAWAREPTAPKTIDLAALPEELQARLKAHGYRAVWHVLVESPLTPTKLHIVAAAVDVRLPDNGQRYRLERVSELASAVLLRSQSGTLLDFAATQDPVTELANQAAFYLLADKANQQRDRAALQLGLDGFRLINKNLGRAVGDVVLRIVADRLRVMCEIGDQIGRLTDDQFAVLITTTNQHQTIEERANSLAEELRAALHEPVIVAGRSLSLTVSIGVAFCTGGVSTDHLLTWADQSLYDAKRFGGGHICRFSVDG